MMYDQIDAYLTQTTDWSNVTVIPVYAPLSDGAMM